MKVACLTRPRLIDRHWWVLLCGLAIAASGWLFWLRYGAGIAHSSVAAQITAGLSTAGRAAIQPSAPSAAQVSAADASKLADAAEGDRTNRFAEFGQAGDAFGSLNALLTAIAGALVAWAGYLQHLSLKETRHALARAEAEAREERRHRRLQEFEALFFQLMQLTAKAAEQIEGPRTIDKWLAITPSQGQAKAYKRGRMGNAGLNAFARKIFKKEATMPPGRQERLQVLVQLYVTNVFDLRPSELGPYWRLLYQTFRHVAESEFESEAQRVRYANIARGSLSEGAVFLLALNGLTPEGAKFAPLIERFGLLEHMHRRYKKEFCEALLVGYRERAFLGSAERADPAHAWQDTPKLDLEYFASLAPARMNADSDEDLELGFSEGENTNDDERA